MMASMLCDYSMTAADSCFITTDLVLMTWNKVYSLFPKATFMGKTFCLLAQPCRHLDKSVQNLVRAGFQSANVDDLGPDEGYWH